MGTTRVFQTMLNEFLPNDLFKEELIKRDWILQNVEMDNSWLGGTLVVPFKGAGASSVAFGALTSSTDIAQDQYVRGQVTTQPEAWGTLYFDHRDLMEHSKVSVQNFLKMLPDQVDEFIDYMKMVVSLSFLNGTYFAKATADGDASGNLTVDRIERFVIGQKVSIDDDNSSPVTGYVRTISMDTNVVTFYDARTAGSVVNLSTYTVAQNARCYFDGSQSSGFTSLKQSLLSLANGGSTNLYGVAKTAWPYLQAINVSGASSTATTLLQDIFDAYVTIRNKGKGNPEKSTHVVPQFWVRDDYSGSRQRRLPYRPDVDEGKCLRLAGNLGVWSEGSRDSCCDPGNGRRRVFLLGPACAENLLQRWLP
jgi:hypothetical protein